MKEILTNCLHDAGSKITVGNRTKHRLIPPNSTCFMSRFLGVSQRSPNLITLELIITKNGKKGKDRVGRIEVITTVFPIEFEALSLKSNKYQHHPVVEIKSMPFDVSNVKAVSPMDFIGWAYAYKIYLRNTFTRSGIANKWPPGKGQHVNAFASISDKMSKWAKDTIDDLASNKFRDKFTEQLRSLEAGIVKCILNERIKRSQAKIKAIAYLMWSQKISKKELYDMDILYKNYTYYRSLLEAENGLHHNICLSRWQALPINKRKNIKKPSKLPDSSTVESVIKSIDEYVHAGKRPQFENVVLPNNQILINANQQMLVNAWYHHEDLFSIEEE